jgi:hypothetical protein
LRRAPGGTNEPEAEVVDELGGGSVVEILDGPQMADGLTWWWVLELGTGLRGWVAESTATGYRTLFALQ